MFKLLIALALLSPIVALAAADVSPALEPVVRGYEAPKCHIVYKKCCSYRKPVYGKCHENVCHKEKQCKQVYHAAEAEEAAVGEGIDASAKYYNNHHQQKTHRRKQQRHHRKPKHVCHWVKKCYNKEKDCIKSYDEGVKCDDEKKKHGDYSGW